MNKTNTIKERAKAVVKHMGKATLAPPYYFH